MNLRHTLETSLDRFHLPLQTHGDTQLEVNGNSPLQSTASGANGKAQLGIEENTRCNKLLALLSIPSLPDFIRPCGSLWLPSHDMHSGQEKHADNTA